MIDFNKSIVFNRATTMKDKINSVVARLIEYVNFFITLVVVGLMEKTWQR